MRGKIKHITKNAFIAFMSLLIINVSIDAYDFQPIASVNSISEFNYFNSFAEYITEITLGKTNAFPEFEKESTSSKAQFVKHSVFKFYQTDSAILGVLFDDKSNSFVVPLTEQYKYLYFREINPPPPKAC